MPQKNANQLDPLDVVEGLDVPIIVFLIVAAVTFCGLVAAQWMMGALL